MGIGCRRDPLEANVWYVRAADAGYENARQRLEVIRAAAAGGDVDGATAAAGTAPGAPPDGKKMSKAPPKSKDLASNGNANANGANGAKKKFMGIF
jgi:TPR repeat protein